MQVQVQSSDGLPRDQAQAVRDRLAAIGRRIEYAPTDGRVFISRYPSPNGGLFLAEASIVVDGRRFAERATGATVPGAAGDAASGLERQSRRAFADPRIVVPREWTAWAREARRGWSWEGDALVREVPFRDFDEGMEFVGQVARRAQDYKRRPDISIAANRVRLTIANPHHAGITLAELRLAAKVNAIMGGDQR